MTITINVFTVTPENQRRLLERLAAIAQQMAATVPGFLSASFHTSRDGTRVVNYAQFASAAAVRALETRIAEVAEGDPAAAAELRSLATSDFHVYDLAAEVRAAVPPAPPRDRGSADEAHAPAVDAQTGQD